ncbi:hypothetical protein [uncultured Piscinibacter sp.]|uniref:hypothetical protein n=1 Tax=uncultured Piscinibacter sp. TaxID=1131835 RepID=UPI0026176A78|nr:hypothetical protein [uncultured Piscinibacter sp.]
MKLKPFRPLLALIAAASLVACGGGGGGSTPTVTFPSEIRVGTASAGADMTLANFPELSTDAIEALMSAVGGDVVTAQPFGADRSRAASLGRWAAARSASYLVAGRRAQAQAIASETFQCAGGGTLTVTVDDADNNNRLSAGDSASFAFANCIEPVGAPAINGSFALVFNVILLDSQQNPTAFDASVTMTALSVAGLGSLDGSARLWSAPVSGGERSFVRYQDMVSVTNTVSGEKVAVLNFDVDETIATTTLLRLNGSLQLGSDVYAIAQVEPFDTATGDPSTGQLRLTDVQGDELLITARGTLVDRDFFLVTNTTTTPDASIIGTPWSDFRQ